MLASSSLHKYVIKKCYLVGSREKGEHLKQVNLLARMCSIVVKSTRHKSTGPVPPVTSYINVDKLFPFFLVCKIGTIIILAS